MISATDIQRAISGILGEHFPEYPAYLNSNGHADEDYFYVEIMPIRKQHFRAGLYDRALEISLSLVLRQDAQGCVDRTILYDAIDTLDAAILPVVHVIDHEHPAMGDRFITVLGSSSRIVDEVLHYSFSLDFTDILAGEGDGMRDFMEDLYVEKALIYSKEEEENGE